MTFGRATLRLAALGLAIGCIGASPAAPPWLIAALLAPLSPVHAQAQPRGATAKAEERINLDLKSADLRNVLRLLAEVGGVNLILGDEVRGQVTMRLKQVRWSDALRAVLSLHGLEAELHDTILHVAPASHFAAQREAQLSAREQCLASAPLKTRIVPVSYADARQMAALIRPTLTSRGSVSVDARTNSLIVRDVECE